MKTYTYTSADETGIRVEDTETGAVTGPQTPNSKHPKEETPK